jgi:hypothetical protein
MEIPLPFGGETNGQPVTAPVIAPSSSSSSTASVAVSNGTGESTVINLQNGASSSTSSIAFDTSKIPVNPYTVAEGAKSSASSTIAEEKAEEVLHSGAPAIQKHTPKTVTQTGPADLFALLGAAFALFVFVYRKTVTA